MKRILTENNNNVEFSNKIELKFLEITARREI